MVWSRTIGLPASLVAVLLFGTWAVAGETYRDAAHHFDFDLPKGWTKWPSEALAAANRFAGSRVPGRGISYSAGFMPRGNKLGSYPYMLVQIIDSAPSGTYEDIEKKIASEMNAAVKEVKGALSDIAREVSVGTVALDRPKNRIVARYQVTGPDGTKIDGISLVMLGKKETVTLHFYDQSSRFPRSVEKFLLSAHTFSFDKGHRFVSGQRSFNFSWGAAEQGAVIGGLCGLFAAAAFVVVRRAQRIKPPAPGIEGLNGIPPLDQA